MTLRNLEGFFNPRAVAVIGASDRPHSIGGTLMRNLLSAGFKGKILPVNRRRNEVAGLEAWPTVDDLPECPDLAILCVPPLEIPPMITALANRGTRAAIVITAGLSAATMPDGRRVADAMLEAARPWLFRIVGPNCLGMLVPGAALNASFAPGMARPGRLAFVSQSGALATAILDWGNARQIGFSCFVSIGDSLDVDLGDLLDYLGRDSGTAAILLYMESISSPRKFLSAARAAARAKPVIAVKAGRGKAGARAAASHTGALAGDDDMVDAILRRAGILRVDSTLDLFGAAETLAHTRRYAGSRVAMMTNGGGAGVMATDALMAAGGELASLSPSTLEALNRFLPSTWSHANPLDIIGDSPVARYVSTLKVLTEAPEIDAVIFIHAPTAIEGSADIARALIPVIKGSLRNIFTCFMGGDSVREARQLMAAHGIPGYATPEEAVRGFLQTVSFARLQSLLLETPPPQTEGLEANLGLARTMVQELAGSGRTMLTEWEAKRVLALAGIPTVSTEHASGADEAAELACAMGFPVVLKIQSPDIIHKSEVGGIALELGDEAAVREAARRMLARISDAMPAARIDGFSVQAMVNTGTSHELILGCTSDAVFGPVLMFGQGGTAVEVTGDRSFALPPLNLPLARDVISRTRVARLLAGYRNRPPVNMDALLDALLKLSALICACPEILELDINPLLADATGVRALDARMKVAVTRVSPESRLLIRPYPRDLESHLRVEGQDLLLRPVRPEDEPLLGVLLAGMKPEHLYFRFFQSIKEWTHPRLARLTQIDYDREMAFVAISPEGRLLGISRCITDPDNLESEFAVMVHSDSQGRGLGKALLQKLINYARSRGTRTLKGFILAHNGSMMTLARQLGFEVMQRDGAGVCEVVLQLASSGAAGGVPPRKKGTLS